MRHIVAAGLLFIGLAFTQSLPEVPASEVQAFVAQAQRGGRVALRAGIYRLTQPLTLNNPVELVGAGSTQTVITSTAEGYVVSFRGGGKSSATGLAFEYQGKAQAYVVYIQEGEVILTDVAVSGAVRDAANKQGGSGIIVWNDSKLTLNKSVVWSNELEGVAVLDKSQVVIKDSDLSENVGSGLSLYDDSAGQVDNTLFEQNEASGIELFDRSQLTLENSDLQMNGEFGLYVADAASATARENSIQQNTFSGVLARDQAQVTLENNDILSNKEAGILCVGLATSVIRNNLIEKNATNGISASEKARVLAINNLVRGNAEFGLAASKEAVVSAQQNTIEFSGYSGILARDNVQVILERNLLQNNGEHGIFFVGNAGGRAQGNECKQNKLTDLYLEKSSNPTLGTNACKVERQP